MNKGIITVFSIVMILMMFPTTYILSDSPDLSCTMLQDGHSIEACIQHSMTGDFQAVMHTMY